MSFHYSRLVLSNAWFKLKIAYLLTPRFFKKRLKKLEQLADEIWEAVEILKKIEL